MDVTQHLLEETKIAFDREKMAELVKRCIGKFTIADYSEQSGISRSWLSKTVNMKSEFPPSKRILSRLYETRQDTNITLEELFEVGGKAPDTSVVQSTAANSIMTIQAEENLLLGVGIFINALRKMGVGNDSFEMSYQSSKYTICTDGKNYVCYPALCMGDEEAKEEILSNVVLNIIKILVNKIDAEIFVLVDHPTMAANFKAAFTTMKKSVQILYTENYLSAEQYK